MITVLVQITVKDFAQWKIEFDGNAPAREKAGQKSVQIFVDEINNHNITGLFEWDDSERARDFFESDELKEVMEKSGVSTNPKIHYLTKIPG